MKNNPAPEVRFVSFAELVKRSSLCRGTIYNLIEAGDLPRPIRLTANRVAWPSDVIEAWFERKAADGAAVNDLRFGAQARAPKAR